MKYYSDITKKFYDTQGECVKAEAEAKQKADKEKYEKEKAAAERKARAQEVEDARKTMVVARSKYAELLEAFTRDYHTYHLSLTGDDAKKAAPTLFDIFNPFLF